MIDPPGKQAIPSHQKLTEVLGVDYVLGRAESAGGTHVKGLISDEELANLLARRSTTLEAIGYEDLNLEPDHLLLSYVPGGAFKRTRTDELEGLHCNFEMVRKIGSSDV